MQATWMPHEKHGRLTEQSDLPDTVYAFPKQRKEPLTDAQHAAHMLSHDFIKSRASRIWIVLWPSQISRRPRSTMT